MDPDPALFLNGLQDDNQKIPKFFSNYVAS
jgi:hypothetical protein